jgi:hypothetical protein
MMIKTETQIDQRTPICFLYWVLHMCDVTTIIFVDRDCQNDVGGNDKKFLSFISRKKRIRVIT